MANDRRLGNLTSNKGERSGAMKIGHIEECATESGVDLEVSNSNEENIEYKGHIIEVWYDENSNSPWAWHAFVQGFGTHIEHDRDQVVNVAKREIEAKEKLA